MRIIPTATFCNLQFVIATSLPNTAADVAQLRKDFEELKLDIEDILHGQNDINESTRVQLQAIYEPKLGPNIKIIAKIFGSFENTSYLCNTITLVETCTR